MHTSNHIIQQELSKCSPQLLEYVSSLEEKAAIFDRGFDPDMYDMLDYTFVISHAFFTLQQREDLAGGTDWSDNLKDTSLMIFTNLLDVVRMADNMKWQE